MVISLILLFFTCLSLSFFEERFKERDKVIMYILLGLAMIVIAGMREVGSTPDSDAYEAMYYAKDGDITILLTEPSFSLIVSFLTTT